MNDAMQNSRNWCASVCDLKPDDLHPVPSSLRGRGLYCVTIPPRVHEIANMQLLDERAYHWYTLDRLIILHHDLDERLVADVLGLDYQKGKIVHHFGLTDAKVEALIARLDHWYHEAKTKAPDARKKLSSELGLSFRQQPSSVLMLDLGRVVYRYYHDHETEPCTDAGYYDELKRIYEKTQRLCRGVPHL